MIFPQPKKYSFSNEKYRCKHSFEGFSLAEFYKLVKDGSEDIKMIELPSLEQEEYKLTINSNGITVYASCEEGKYRALTSLLQMIKNQKSELSFCEIEDKPQFPKRGYMLDISRCRMPKLDTIKLIVDFLSGLKYNEFQLYMEGGCFKYSAYPKYTEDFDCLDADDIKELELYCKERFIDLIPNQNSFGHLAPWLNHEEFYHLGLRQEGGRSSTINPLLEESLDFVDGLYNSLLPYFSSEYVNIGLDEAYGLGRYQMEDYCQKHGKDVAFMEWLQKLDNLTKSKYGKKVMFWSDMIYGSDRVYNMIPKDAVVLEWGYELIQSQKMTEHCIAFHNAGLNYYVCPSCNTHLSFTGRFDVTSFNIRTAAEIGARYGAKGLMMTDWGCEEGHPHFWVWSMVPCALAGQYAWNVGEEQNGENFKAQYIHNAQKYVDTTIFGGAKVSELMYRMSNYYLLEPERVHVGTMCGELFQRPIEITKFNHLYDLKDSGDEFYFNNVSRYVKEVMADIEKVEFDSQMKREIILNSKMVILSSEICKLRLGYKMSNSELDKLIDEIGLIEGEYYELWCKRNFEKGVEHFMNQLAGRKNELLALKKLSENQM